MGIVDTLRRLFGGGAGPATSVEPVEYHGYRITPAPQRQASGWNTAGVIAKTPRTASGAPLRPGRYAHQQGRRDRLLDHQSAADHR